MVSVSPYPALLCAAAMLFGGTAAAQSNAVPQTLQQQLQACARGTTTQDTQTCITEARRAHAAGKAGDLDTDKTALAANATRRCAVFTGEEMTACLARMQGDGSRSGSVAGGGILRAVETVVQPQDAGAVSVVPRTTDPVIRVPDQR